jgi:hypothetical protein
VRETTQNMGMGKKKITMHGTNTASMIIRRVVSFNGHVHGKYPCRGGKCDGCNWALRSNKAGHILGVEVVKIALASFTGDGPKGGRFDWWYITCLKPHGMKILWAAEFPFLKGHPVLRVGSNFPRGEGFR